MSRVHVVGAGIAGMTAAHELAERGYEVHVYEVSDEVGGKAASQPMTIGRRTADCLGEHGFRFFPWFYRHLPDTLARIPMSFGRSVFDLLREAEFGGVAFRGRLHRIIREPNLMDAFELTRVFFGDLGVSVGDMARYGFRLSRFWVACEERKMVQFENQSWAEYIGIDERGFYSPEFRELIKDIPLMLVAMRADKGSARTIGHASIQLMTNIDPSTNDLADAILAAPTSHSWMRPWKAHLENLGVVFHMRWRLQEMVLNGDDDAVAELRFEGKEPIDVSADQFVCAIPIESMHPFLDQIDHADASLRELRKLIEDRPPPVGNMVGVQYALREDIPLVRGHVAFGETDWALTAVSQPQFWSEVKPTLAEYFRIPKLRGVISAIASSWDSPVRDESSPVFGKAARDCTEAEILREIWRQMRVTLGPGSLPDETEETPWLHAQVDRNVSFEPFVNRSPLLVHPPGSYLRRPEAEVRGVRNLALASDYVRTRTDIATMESANEAGRHAARAVLKRTGSQDSPRFFEFELGMNELRAADCLLWRFGRPHLFDATEADLDLPERAAEGVLAFDGDRETAMRVLANAREALPLLERGRREWSPEALREWQARLTEGTGGE